VEDGLGQEGSRDAGAIMGWAARAMLDSHEAIHLEQRQGAHEILMVVTQRPQFLGQDGEELILEDSSETAENIV
jgi:hypothetical protein